MLHTLTEIIKEKSGMRTVGITFIDGLNKENFLSYEELYEASLRSLSYLQSQGLQAKDELVFQIDDNRNFIVIFWACIMGGIIPIPLAVGQTHDQRQKLFNIWPCLNNPHLIISNANLSRLGKFMNDQEDIYPAIKRKVIDETECLISEKKGRIFECSEDDIAFIQFSSGSTGTPKGVTLTHKNLVSNIKAISQAAAYTYSDSMLSWMPLTHDMGLIGFHLNPLFVGINHYIIPTSVFVRNPTLWLEKVNEHKTTILCSPNFGYRYLLRYGNNREIYDWDLSHVKILYNGAEPISNELCAEFLKVYSRYNLRNGVIRPVYGLAEASLAVTISEIGGEIEFITVDRNELRVGGKISVDTSKNPISFVCVGKPVSECSIRIVEHENCSVDEETVGHVEIKGCNVTTGYYNNEEETAKVLSKDGWLRTGDLGFVKSGMLYITGRFKDIIFINGQNYYPHDIEKIAEAIDAIELNKIAVAGFYNSKAQKEEVIAFVLHRGNIEKFISIAESLRKHINIAMGIVLDRVIPVREIPKTTSGKLQRFRLLQQYCQGDFDHVEVQLNCYSENRNLMSLVLPSGDVEQKLWDIWTTVLEKNNFGVTESFFEIGGDSLKAARVSMLVIKELCVELTHEKLYDKRTIRALAEEIASLDKKTYLPIQRTTENALNLVSSSQRRFYYLWEINRTSIAYNIPVAFEVQGGINIKKLEDSIRQLISRHELLRTSFRLVSEPMSIVREALEFSLTCLECHTNDIKKYLKELVQPFDLLNGPLFRIKLLKTRPGEYLLFLDFHHIIFDGVSIRNFLQELLILYRGNGLPAQNLQYKDFCGWEKQNLNTEKIRSQLEYWQSQLSGKLPVLEMPLDFVRPAIFSNEGSKREFQLSKRSLKRLKDLAKRQNCTLHTLLFTLYSVLLAKYTMQDEIIIGIPVERRRHPDLLYLIGMFVNNIAIRSTINGDESFVRLLQRVRNIIIDGLDNQDVPFQEVMDVVDKERDISRNPIFDSMFIYQAMGVPKDPNGDLHFSRYFFDPGVSKFDISIEFFEVNEDLVKYEIEYFSKLFREETITRLAVHFDNLINNVLDNPDSQICELSVLTASQIKDYTTNFKVTTSDPSYFEPVHRLFERQASLAPNAIALECNSNQFTYGQLNKSANVLAQMLRERGVNQGDIIAVLLPRSFELIISILGILKSGACFVPVDVDLPDERIKFLICASRSKLILTGDGLVSHKTYDALRDKMEFIDACEIVASEAPEVDTNCTINNLAYILYTSGTTGDPKGVMIEHRSLSNYIVWAAQTYIKRNPATFALFTSISFDLTMTSIFAPLITGNKIIIYEEDENALALNRVIEDNKINFIKLTPSHLRLMSDHQLLNSQSKIQSIIVGGEQFESQLGRRIYNLFEGNVDIYNEYGPTEATIGCMIHNFDPADQATIVPIGVPVMNTQIYVLDRFLKPVPIGVHGEIYISGDCLARGYLFNEELTNQKFILNPFLADKRMYKTGDVAKRLPSGIIEFVGRYDSQVKINGYRIELSEIENHLGSHKDIKECLAIAKMGKGQHKLLYAFYISDDEIEESVLRRYAVEKLPYYMVPAQFVRLGEIPLTKNGKVDYAALSCVEPNRNISESGSPESDMESVLLKVWKDIFDTNDLTVTDNFFELGGDSIKAVQISGRLMDDGIVLKVSDILTYHTIRQTSPYAAAGYTENRYIQGPITGEKNLSPIESWFFNRNFENPNYYNQSVVLKLKQKSDVQLLKKVFNKLIVHHDGLRLNYNSKSKKLFYNNQYLENDFTIEEFDIESTDSLEEICVKIKSGLDIQSRLLIKAAIIKQKNVSEFLFITLHHLVADGISWRILMEDLYSLWNAYNNGRVLELPKKTASLIDWMEERAKKELRFDANYWKTIENCAFSIPQDFVTDDWRVINLRESTGLLDEENTNFLLRNAHRVYKTDVSILLNTALLLALKTWTGLNRLVVEQENHGRHLSDIDTSRTLGWFTALFPAKFEIAELSIGEQIKHVKEHIKGIPDHGMGYRHEKINKLAEIRFNYLGQFNKELQNDIFCYCDYYHGAESDPSNLITAKIELNLMIVDDKLTAKINYNRKAFAESSVNKFRDLFFENLLVILAHLQNEHTLSFTPSDFIVDLDQEELDALFQ